MIFKLHLFIFLILFIVILVCILNNSEMMQDKYGILSREKVSRLDKFLMLLFATFFFYVGYLSHLFKMSVT